MVPTKSAKLTMNLLSTSIMGDNLADTVTSWSTKQSLANKNQLWT